MRKKLQLAVLISGNGSNLQALIDECKQDKFPARINCVISNNPKAYGLKRAELANIPTLVVNHLDFAKKADFEDKLHQILVEHQVELVCLAGFMRLLSGQFVNKWHNKIINIHPSLLPAFKGLHAQEQAIQAGARIGGCTVHYVRPDMDSGPIIIQGCTQIFPEDDADSLAIRILDIEHKCYRTAVKLIAEGKVQIQDEKVMINNHSTPYKPNFLYSYPVE